jgi:hypothetical protein
VGGRTNQDISHDLTDGCSTRIERKAVILHSSGGDCMPNNANGCGNCNSSSLLKSLMITRSVRKISYQSLQSSHNINTNLNRRESGPKSSCREPKTTKNEQESFAIDIRQLSTE